ncbi:hypothetical protein LINPERHAP1_LOCUS12092, partial [Linum perenne]
MGAGWLAAPSFGRTSPIVVVGNRRRIGLRGVATCRSLIRRCVGESSSCVRSDP